MKRARFFLPFGIVTAMLVAAPVALAHANLVRSEPAANSAQTVPPTQVRLWFSEDIEPSFSSVTVVDKDTVPVDKGDSQRMSDDAKGMQVSLKDNLPQGLYTVIWKTTSAVDGHVTSGSFAFTIGSVPLTESSPREIMSLVDTALNNSAAPPLYQVIVRWLNVLLLALLVGSFTFPVLILFPALGAAKSGVSLLHVYGDYFRSSDPPTESAAALETWTTRWRRYTHVVFVVYVLVTVVTLIAQAYTVGGSSIPIFRVLATTRFGAVWLVRAAVLVALGIVLLRTRWQFTPRLHANRALLLAVALGLLLLITQSLDSHGAAVSDPPVIPLVVDLIHLFGVVIWIGGLVQLLVTLPPLLRAAPAPAQARTLSAVISTFSLVAFLSVGAIILSGVYSMIVQVGSLEAFFATLYGETLLVKFVLIIPLLALGALNLIVIRNAYARHVERAAPLVLRVDVVVVLEVVFAVAVLLTVGYLTSIAPAKGAYDPSSQLWIQTNQADDLTVTLGVLPALVGANDFDVKVQDAAGQPVTDASVVRLLGTMREMDMGTQQIAVAEQGNGHYTVHGDLMSMAGTWQIQVLVRRAGHDDVQTTYVVSALNQRTPQPALSLLEQSTTAQLGLGLTLFGFAMGTASVLLLKPRRARWTSLAGALVVSTIGAAAVYQVVAAVPAGQVTIVPVVPGYAHLQPNPVRPIPAQIALGRQTYLQNCATCHGDNGKGDGPAAANLNPKPADLTAHVPLHTDGDLYWWVTNGISGTAMPAWDPNLTDLQRWQVVTFLKSAFGAAAPSQPAPPPATPAPQSIVLSAHPAADMNLALTISPIPGAPQTFDAAFSDANKQPSTDIQNVTLEVIWLDQDSSSANVTMEANSDRHFRAVGDYVSQPGMWLLRVTARRKSGNVVAEFPYAQAANGTPSDSSDSRALQMLKQSDARMNALKSLRATQELNDGKFGSVTTYYEYAAPDRLRFRVVGGMESIAVASKQFDRNNGTWSSRPRVDPVVFPNFDNASHANSAQFGRTDTLDGVPVQIVESISMNGDEVIHYAFWIGVDDHLVHQFAMVAPGHYMMEYYSDFDAPIDIQAPSVSALAQR